MKDTVLLLYLFSLHNASCEDSFGNMYVYYRYIMDWKKYLTSAFHHRPCVNFKLIQKTFRYSNTLLVKVELIKNAIWDLI